jgi:nucleoside-diphosphate-sugar epimerase
MSNGCCAVLHPTGFLGEHLVNQLVYNNFRVKAAIGPDAEKSAVDFFKTDDSLKKAIDSKKLDLVTLKDEHDPAELKAFLSGVDYVFLLPRGFPTQQQQDYNTLLKNVLNHVRVEFEACKEAGGIKKIVFTSSVSTFIKLCPVMRTLRYPNNMIFKFRLSRWNHLLIRQRSSASTPKWTIILN